MAKEDEEKNAYEIVGVGIDATDADIKKAFRQRSLKTHPDRVRCPRPLVPICALRSRSFTLRTPTLKMQACSLSFSSKRTEI
jgi:hypothetical protein